MKGDLDRQIQGVCYTHTHTHKKRKKEKKLGLEAQTWMWPYSKFTFKDCCGCTVLAMPESKEVMEVTEWRAKQSSQVFHVLVCVSSYVQVLPLNPVFVHNLLFQPLCSGFVTEFCICTCSLCVEDPVFVWWFTVSTCVSRTCP